MSEEKEYLLHQNTQFIKPDERTKIRELESYLNKNCSLVGRFYENSEVPQIIFEKSELKEYINNVATIKSGYEVNPLYSEKDPGLKNYYTELKSEIEDFIIMRSKDLYMPLTINESYTEFEVYKRKEE